MQNSTNDRPQQHDRASAPRRVRGARGSFLLWSVVAHAAVGSIAGYWLGIPGLSRSAAPAFELAFAPATPDEARSDPVAPPEPERALATEAVSEPMLVEEQVPAEEPLEDTPNETEVPTVADFVPPIVWSNEPFAPLRPSAPSTEEQEEALAKQAAAARLLSSESARSAPTASAVVVSAHADPRSCPPPAYPRLALQHAWQGTTLIEAQIDAQGRVLSSLVIESSRYPVLDEAARTAVLAWHFDPATRDGVAEAGRVRVPIVWKLVH